MRTIDRRNTALGHQHARTRSQNAIRRICIHHSVTPTTHTTANFENWWRNPISGMGVPPVGGYHEVILHNGDMELNFNPTQIAHGVASQNDDSYHICVVGNFRTTGPHPTAAQMESLVNRIRFNMNRFNIPIERVLGHNEFPHNASNTCPGQDMHQVRNLVSKNDTTRFINTNRIPLRKLASSTSAEVGSRLNIGQKVTLLGPTTRSANALGDWINIRVGVRKGWVREARLSRSNPTTPTITVGSQIQVNSTATRWATGQAIPAWVRGQTYTVQQLRNNNTEALLAGIISWININDITLI